MSDANILSVTPNVVIYGKENCVFCDKAKEAFDSVEIKYDYRSLAEALGLPDKDGKTPPFNTSWRSDGTAGLLAKWAMHMQPTPFILVNGVGHDNLMGALDAIDYRDRKKRIVERKRHEKEIDSRSDP